MRIDAHTAEFRAGRKLYRAFLNGILLTEASMADDVAGEARIPVLDDQGLIQVAPDGESILEEIVRGVVTIEEIQ